MSYKIITNLLIMVLMLSGNLRAQNDVGPSVNSVPHLPGEINEKIELITDRTLYATGENIRFSAFLYNPDGSEADCWSRVVYLELFTPDGTSVARGKYPCSCTTAEGTITVPDQLLTGNYYLVAYTKWMLNYSPRYYTCRLVKIINPFSSELEQSCLQGGTGLPYMKEAGRNGREEVILCTPNRTSYQPGEDAGLSILLPSSARPLASRFTIMAGKPVIIEDLDQAIVTPDSINFQSSGSIRYLPDVMGLSLTGKVYREGTSEPADNVLVELSILGKDPRFLAYHTGDDGSFFFALDSLTGRREMVIAAREPAGTNVEIRVDNDFAPVNFAFAPRPFSLSDAEREEATRIMLNMQLLRSYQAGVTVDPAPEIVDKGNFYGPPTSRIQIDYYIELPNLQEVVIELLPEVHYRPNDPTSPLQFAGNRITQPVIGNFVPLVLVDQVPVYDLVTLLEHSTRNLNTIEVVNDFYVIGNTTYSGILSIASKKGDLAGIDLPANSFFFDFDTYQPQGAGIRIDGSGADEEDPVPDLRNCILWDPGLELSPGQTAELNFRTPDRPGRYQVLVRGLAEDGNIIQGRCEITVD